MALHVAALRPGIDVPARLAIEQAKLEQEKKDKLDKQKKEQADKLKIEVIWGYDWGWDSPHWELNRRFYPA